MRKSFRFRVVFFGFEHFEYLFEQDLCLRGLGCGSRCGCRLDLFRRLLRILGVDFLCRGFFYFLSRFLNLIKRFYYQEKDDRGT